MLRLKVEDVMQSAVNYITAGKQHSGHGMRLPGCPLKCRRLIADRIEFNIIFQISPKSQDEIEARRFMTGASRAAAFLRKPVEEHRVALVAESPGPLFQPRYRDVVRQDEIEARRLMTGASRAVAFVRKPVEEHRVALVAESPVRLCLTRSWDVMRQEEIEALGHMTTAGWAATFVGKPIEEKGVALVAKSPFDLVGHIPLLCFEVAGHPVGLFS